MAKPTLRVHPVHESGGEGVRANPAEWGETTGRQNGSGDGKCKL
jgi:hypothetical protein